MIHLNTQNKSNPSAGQQTCKNQNIDDSSACESRPAFLSPGPYAQQVGGGDSPPSLCCQEIPPGILHPGLGSSMQERHGHVKVGLEEAHEDDQRAGAPVL